MNLSKGRGGGFLSNADEYIQKFKELEAAVKETYGLKDWDSVTGFLSKQDGFKPYKEEIKYCQEVRNLLQHKQKIGGEYPIEPTKEMLVFLENTINKIKNRKKCGEIMIPRSRTFYKKKSDKIRGTVPKMRENSLSHVPILDERGSVCGVFSLFSFFNIMADRVSSENSTFGDICEYIALDYHRTETYCFVSRKLYTDELKALFEKTYSGGKRLSMVFVTQNGKPDEKLLGIISPWDILGKE